METSQENSRSRLQFSLRRMLVLVLLVAIVSALWSSNERLSEIPRLESEIKRLKNELGELIIKEGQEEKVHAVSVPQVESLMWKWRIYVPQGRNFYLRLREGTFSAGGKLGENTTHTASCNLGPGEQTVTVALRKNHKDQWNWIVNRESGAVSCGVGQEIIEMIENDNYETITYGVRNKQTALEPGSNLELLRLMLLPSPNSRIATDAGPGIVVFVNEI